MTSITTESITHRPSRRFSRQSVLGFVAGVALASTVAVGVNAFGTDHPAAEPSSTSAAVTVPFQPSPDLGCRLVHDGSC